MRAFRKYNVMLHHRAPTQLSPFLRFRMVSANNKLPWESGSAISNACLATDKNLDKKSQNLSIL